MHPLDSSLDASVHGHAPTGSRVRVIRRRSSIDNGFLADSNEIIALVAGSGSGGSGSDHSGAGILSHYDYYSSYEHGDYGTTTNTRRRLSLNLNYTTNTTFLATPYNHTMNAEKCDLDQDCHANDYNLAVNNNSSSLSYHSRISRGTSSSSQQQRHGGAMHHNNSSSGGRVSRAVSDDGIDCDDNGNDNDASSDIDDDEDSFCEAHVAEPANQEYMMQDLGASCFWNDADLFPKMNLRRGGQRTVAENKGFPLIVSTTKESNDVNENSSAVMDGDKTMDGDLDADVEALMDDNHNDGEMVDATGDEVVVSYHTSTTDEDYGEDGGEDEELPYLQDEDDEGDVDLVHNNETATMMYHRGDHHNDYSSDCDSFCDAGASEAANAEYLTRDLGASCYWNDTDELMLQMAERDDNNDDAGIVHNTNTGEINNNNDTSLHTIGTITEEVV